MTTVNILDDGTIEGYLTMTEWGRKVNLSESTVRLYVNSNKIKSLLVYGKHYIKEDTKAPARKRLYIDEREWIDRVIEEIRQRGELYGN